MKHLIDYRYENDAADHEEQAAKRSRTDDMEPLDASVQSPEAIQYPFFHYRDFSKVTDPDPLIPLTAPGRVPNFPAKMHAILSRPDLVDVICWMPHGRSWKVHKPREFEVSVLPIYFEHSKFSSFIRQANGWGFRRINSGRDRNSYYHPQFLRGLPHLCKDMKRPGVSQKAPVDPDHEPDLYRISEMCPVPERAGDDSIMLFSTLNGGPKARISVASILPHNSALPAGVLPAQATSAQDLTPRDQEALAAFYASLSKMGGNFSGLSQDASMMMSSTESAMLSNLRNNAAAMSHHFNPGMSVSPGGMMNPNASYQTLAAANQLAFSHSAAPLMNSTPTTINPSLFDFSQGFR
jgi:HSF-type DNA-binding